MSPYTTKFEHNLNNSFEFVEFLKQTEIPPQYKFVSLDVTSIFSSIPKNLVIEIIKKGFRFTSSYTLLNLKTIIELIELYLPVTIFLPYL